MQLRSWRFPRDRDGRSVRERLGKGSLVRAGLGYAVLAVVLTFFFGVGVFVIPLMVRADIRRLHGGSGENSDQPAQEI